MKISSKFPTIHSLAIDLGISIASFLIIFSSFHDHLSIAPIGFALFLFVRLLFFILFETQKSSHKLGNIGDLKKLLFALTLSTLILIIISSIDIISSLSNFVNWRFYSFEMSLSFLMLAARRIVFTTIPNPPKNKGLNSKNAVIYGAGFEGVKLYEAISKNESTKLNVIAFIEEDKSLIGKKINDIRVAAPEYLDSNKIKDQIELVILNKSDNSSHKKIINICYKQGIEVLEVPPISEWLNQGFSNKQLKKISIDQLLGRDEIQLSNPVLNSFLQGKTILITGAAGSIGSEITLQILSYAPGKLILLDQNETALYHLENEIKEKFKNSSYEIVVADITNTNRLKQIFQRFSPQIVYHAAAYKHVPLMETNPIEAVATNIFGSINLVDLCLDHQVQTFVFISTDKAVNPTNVMGATKRATEIYIQAITETSSTKFITTRFGNVLGSNGSVIPLFEKQIESGGPITITDERITRYFMTINEACQLVLEASVMGEESEIFVFDMGESVKIIDLARKMIYLSGLKEGKDIQIISVGLRPGEKLYEELLATEENTFKTHHPKILIGKSQQIERETLKQFESLRSLLNAGDEYAVIEALKQIVPEFKSNNSKFSSLD